MSSCFQDDHEVKSKEEVNCNYPKDLKIETISDSTSNNKTYQNLIWALDINLIKNIEIKLKYYYF